MKGDLTSRIPQILHDHEQQILNDWIKFQITSSGARKDLIAENDLRRESAEFLSLVRETVQHGNIGNIEAPEWKAVRDMLTGLSRSRGRLGFSPGETASFIFSLKQPLYDRLRTELEDDGKAMVREIWAANMLLDRLGLFTMEIYQKAREEVIRRQQQELMELSTPVVRLWEGVLALPLIGTLDSARTQVVMESLLKGIVETGSQIAIIDITGVPMVDTLVAQHLIKTVAAARLMGAECIISGIRPQIAQTIVHLGVNLGDIITKATLADAFRMALARTGQVVAPAPQA